jgi:cell fate regulator YaaT (PSP1 superfamily)
LDRLSSSSIEPAAPLAAHLTEVAFKGNRKEFFLWEGEEPLPVRTRVIVEADRGEDLGSVHATGESAARRNERCGHGLAGALPSRRVLRLASTDEARRGRDTGRDDEAARQRAMERVKANSLVMKVSDAEWQFDRRKLTLYFTADKRVDFRNLVRELASIFRARIELKQIGVRDEAKRLDGIGRCGRQYCSASWLPELRPVNLGVAKDQRLSLNPSQISGACGRLMCCLRYEHEFYVQSRKRFPKEGRILALAHGEEKVIANDIFGDRVTLRREDGEVRVVPLAELRRELGVAGALPGEPSDAAGLGGRGPLPVVDALEPLGPFAAGDDLSDDLEPFDAESDRDDRAIDTPVRGHTPLRYRPTDTPVRGYGALRDRGDTPVRGRPPLRGSGNTPVRGHAPFRDRDETPISGYPALPDPPSVPRVGDPEPAVGPAAAPAGGEIAPPIDVPGAATDAASDANRPRRRRGRRGGRRGKGGPQSGGTTPPAEP